LDALKGENEDQDTGINIIRLAIESPLRTIVANAGGEGSVVINKIRENKGNLVTMPEQMYMKTYSKQV
jgi:chaperonin GroEL